jgi:16S rRNA (guanine966-N2)-methyltransferase
MAAHSRLRGAPRQVRIIGGPWKRTPLPVPDVAGLRPTPDRVRETLFNWLQHLRPDSSALRGLDLFAGTGALGFELASRGARSVLLVESNPRALESLRATRERLAASAVDVRPGDGLSVAAQLAPESYDVVFLDPPFDADLQSTALIAARRLLAGGGLVYLEAPAALTPEQAQQAGLEIVRSGRAGQVAFHLLRQPTA